MTANQTFPFFHIELRGSAYQAGLAQGQALAGIPGWANFLRSGHGLLTAAQAAETLAQFERFCPGINAETHGLADALGAPVESIIYYANSYLRRGATETRPASGCSHLAALPGKSADGHVRVARSYDYSPQADDFRLVSTHIEGKYAHIGCSVMLLGRCDGLNEHGLAVTTSSGGMPVGPMRPAIQDGFQFWALCRAILETCHDVDSALALIAEFPLACNPNLILADRGGSAALVELHGSERAVRRIDAGSSAQAVFSTNHYQLPEMQRFQPQGCMNHSLQRAETMARFLNEHETVSNEDLHALLAAPYPAGLACHFYEEFFGTMHALVFDLTTGEAQVCFGSPAANPVHTLRLSDTPASAPYIAALPMEKAPVEFWK